MITAARQGQPRARRPRAVPQDRCSTGRRPSSRSPASRGPPPTGGSSRRSAAAFCDQYEAKGLVGRPIFWARDRRRILADLDATLVRRLRPPHHPRHRAAGRRARLRVRRRRAPRRRGRAARRPHAARARPHRPHRHHPRRHRPRRRLQDRLAPRRLRAALRRRPRGRRHQAPAPALRPGRPPRREGPHRGGAGRVLVRHLARASSSGSATTSPPRCSTQATHVLGEIVDRHRARRVRAPPLGAVHLLLDRVPRLQPRRPRHRRAPQAVGAQALRPRAGPLRRARRAARGGACRHDRDAPPDQAARDRIATDLGTTLFVEAGAGSGKTTALVAPRRRAGHARATVELRNIAAITFTEKAGAELRDRVRRELQERADRPDHARRGGGRAAGWRSAQLDGAAIGTLHSFAQRLLSRAPGGGAAPAQGRGARRGVLGGGLRPPLGPRARRAPRRPRASSARSSCCTPRGVDPKKLRSLALAFEASWDLVEDLVPAEAARAAVAAATWWPRSTTQLAALAPLAGRVHRPHRPAAGSPSTTSPPSASACDRLATTSSTSWTRCSPARPSYAENAGSKGSWRCNKEQVHAQLAAVVDHRRRGAPAGARRLRPPHRRRPAPPHPRGGRPPPRGRHARVPRPARAGPPGAARPGAGPDRASERSTSATSGCCSTSSRTPTRSRSSWPCGSPPPIPPTADEPGWADVDVGAGPAVRGRRPEAVDLPVPPRRHLHLPRRRATASRRRPAAPVELQRQLPHRRPGDRLGEPHLRARCSSEAPDTDVPVPSQPRLRRPARPARRAARSARRSR